MSDHEPVIGSLCSGYGGLDLGVQAVLGGRVAWHVEYDKDPSAILRHHWPDVPNHGDVKTTDWTTVEPVDILTAGYPCQPFSHAGKRKGADDPRHLWPDVARAIRVLRPGLVVLENVRGHVSLGLADVLGDLSALGYDATWGVVRASDAGAPHGRARIFIVATDADSTGFQGHRRAGSNGWPVPAATGRRLTAADAARHRRDQGWAESAGLIGGPHAAERGGAATAHAGRERHGSGQDRRAVGRVDDPDAGASREREQSRGVAVDRGAAASVDTDRDGLARVEGVSSRRDSVHGDSWSDAHGRSVGVEWGAYAAAVNRWADAIGRPAPDPTEPGRNGPRLSPTFVEWMMGLPAGHVTGTPGLSRNAQLKALGNGVVPQQAALALRTLLPILTGP